MSNDLLKQAEEFINDTSIFILSRAILSEVLYQYNDIKMNYTDFNNTDLSLDDLKNITDRIMSTQYMNDLLNDIITDYLYDYIDNKGGK